VLKFNQFYSSGSFGSDYQLKVVYDCTADTLNESEFKDAILKIVADMYRNRENNETENPRGAGGVIYYDARRMLDPLRYKTWQPYDVIIRFFDRDGINTGDKITYNGLGLNIHSIYSQDQDYVHFIAVNRNT